MRCKLFTLLLLGLLAFGLNAVAEGAFPGKASLPDSQLYANPKTKKQPMALTVQQMQNQDFWFSFGYLKKSFSFFHHWF